MWVILQDQSQLVVMLSLHHFDKQMMNLLQITKLGALRLRIQHQLLDLVEDLVGLGVQMRPDIPLIADELLDLAFHHYLIVLKNVADNPPDVDDLTPFRPNHVLIFVEDQIAQPLAVVRRLLIVVYDVGTVDKLSVEDVHCFLVPLDVFIDGILLGLKDVSERDRLLAMKQRKARVVFADHVEFMKVA